MFVLSPKAYEFFKNLVQLILPGLGTLYFSIAKIWELGYGEQVVATLAAIATFLGIVLKISSNTYDKLEMGFDGDMIVTEDEDGGQTMRLDLKTDADVLALKDKISFKKVVQSERPLVAEDAS